MCLCFVMMPLNGSHLRLKRLVVFSSSLSVSSCTSAFHWAAYHKVIRCWTGHCSCTITGPSCCRLQAAAEHSSFVTSHFMTLKIVKFWHGHLFEDKVEKMHVINICTCANLVFWVLAVKVLCNNNDLSAVQTFFVIQTTVGRRKNMYFNNEGFRRIQLKPALDNLICIMNWKSWKWISRT